MHRAHTSTTPSSSGFNNYRIANILSDSDVFVGIIL